MIHFYSVLNELYTIPPPRKFPAIILQTTTTFHIPLRWPFHTLQIPSDHATCARIIYTSRRRYAPPNTGARRQTRQTDKRTNRTRLRGGTAPTPLTRLGSAAVIPAALCLRLFPFTISLFLCIKPPIYSFNLSLTSAQSSHRIPGYCI